MAVLPEDVVLQRAVVLEVRKAGQILHQVEVVLQVDYLVEKGPQAGTALHLEIALQACEETVFRKVQNPQRDYYTYLHSFFPYHFLILYVKAEEKVNLVLLCVVKLLAALRFAI